MRSAGHNGGIGKGLGQNKLAYLSATFVEIRLVEETRAVHTTEGVDVGHSTPSMQLAIGGDAPRPLPNRLRRWQTLLAALVAAFATVAAALITNTLH
jgi:hypothetical protein